MNSVFNRTNIRKLGCHRLLYNEIFKRISDFGRGNILNNNWVNNNQTTYVDDKEEKATHI